MAREVELLPGERFERLVVMRKGGRLGGRIAYACLCDCGNMKIAAARHLRNGDIKSCGCLRREFSSAIKHGLSSSRTYRIWVGILQRTSNPRSVEYKRYGERGIGIDDEWRSFTNFIRDMGLSPDGMEIDRIDNSKGYSKENCRWADRKTQQRNKRTNVMWTYNGESRCISDWAEFIGMNRTSLWIRVYQLGWSIERALTSPVLVRSNGKTSFIALKNKK